MAPLLSLDAILRAVVIAGYALLLLKLCKANLHRTYRFFVAYLIVRLTRSLVLLALPMGTSIYGWTYVFTEPILWVFYVLVVLELYSLVFRNYKGIASLSRWALGGALCVSVVLSLLSLYPDLSSPQPYPILLHVSVMERAIVSSIAIFLLLITGFLVFYPVPLSRNVIVHCIVYSVYFLSLTMTKFIRNVVGPQTVLPLNMALLILTCATLLLWILFLTPAGENKTVVLRYQWTEEDEDRLIQQLDSINSTLLRAARK